MLATTFILILAAIFSLVVSKYIPKVSTNYISILVGILCGLIPIIGEHVASFNPEIFMILLVAPLLFYEGQETPLSFVRHHMREIFGVTVIMVLLSTLVAGFSLTYALGLSLPAAFVMAAISTPTDATATSSVSEGLKLPSKITRILKMESLFNDASGIVLLQATALWLVKNELSIRHTVSEFFISAIGGFFLGFFVSTLIMLFRQKMLRLFEDTVSLQTLIYLLTPFAIYFLAEEASVSGILAVVAAGLVHNSEERAALFTDSRRTFIARETQRMFADLLNSLVFVIFGITSVRIISEQFSWQNISLWGLSGLVLYLANLVVRYGYARLVLHQDNYNAWVFSLGGVHGAVTLALVFTLPGLGVASMSFNLILMAELTLIILSMLVPTILFRFILPKKSASATRKETIAQIKDEMMAAGIAEVKKMHLPKRFEHIMIYYLKDQLSASPMQEFIIRWSKMAIIPQIRNAKFQQAQYMIFRRFFMAEREYLNRAVEKKKISAEDAYYIYEESLIAEAVLIDPYTNDEKN